MRSAALLAAPLTFTHRSFIIVTSFAIGLSVLGCIGTETSTSITVKSESETPTPDASPNVVSSAVEDAIVVPDGNAELLFGFINSLDRELNAGASRNESDAAANPASQAQRAAVLRRVMEARIEACDKILARDVPEETRLRAIRIQLDAMRTLVALFPQEMEARFNAHMERLEAANDPLLARMAKATRFQIHVNESLSGNGPSRDDLTKELQALLDDPEAGPETLEATREAAGWLLQFGKLDATIDAFQRINLRFKGHEDENLAGAAAALSSEATHLEITRLAKDVTEQRNGALENLLLKLQELLDGDDQDGNVLPYAMQTAQLLEFSGHAQPALRAYKLIQQRYQDDADRGLASDVQRSVELASRRLSLIGQSLRIDGVHLNGDAFDADDYRGKWVVVCFWTTWHDNWPEESMNIRKSVAAYQDPPVEVVAINLDDDRNLLERYLKERPTHWPVLVDADPASAGFENSNAIRCGVEAVPFILLMNPRGEVVDVHLMGERLPSALAEHVKL